MVCGIWEVPNIRGPDADPKRVGLLKGHPQEETANRRRLKPICASCGYASFAANSTRGGQ